jgi:hypothetical protein
MSDLIFVAATVAFFLVANAFVTLCNRVLGPGPTTTTRPRSGEHPAADAAAAAERTELTAP